MKQQNLQNHSRIDPAFHFVLLLATLLLIIFAIINFVQVFTQDKDWMQAVLFLLVAVFATVTFMLVRSYATKVQDRAIRAEENFRHYVLTSKPLDSRLNIRQIIALRFASDEEFPQLAAKAASGSLKPDEIKGRIKNWKADFHRV